MCVYLYSFINWHRPICIWVGWHFNETVIVYIIIIITAKVILESYYSIVIMCMGWYIIIDINYYFSWSTHGGQARINFWRWSLSNAMFCCCWGRLVLVCVFSPCLTLWLMLIFHVPCSLTSFPTLTSLTPPIISSCQLELDNPFSAWNPLLAWPTRGCYPHHCVCLRSSVRATSWQRSRTLGPEVK